MSTPSQGEEDEVIESPMMPEPKDSPSSVHSMFSDKPITGAERLGFLSTSSIFPPASFSGV